METESLQGREERTGEKEVKGAARWDSLGVFCSPFLPQTENGECFYGCLRDASVKDERKLLIEGMANENKELRGEGKGKRQKNHKPHSIGQNAINPSFGNTQFAIFRF